MRPRARLGTAAGCLVALGAAAWRLFPSLSIRLPGWLLQLAPGRRGA